MGITADETVVVYDGPGMFSAPRVWWMFRVMGVKNVLVLDGGFDNWKAANFPVTAEATKSLQRCSRHHSMWPRSSILQK